LSDDTPAAPVVDKTAISPEHRERIVQVLNEKIPGGGKCTICSAGDFLLSSHFSTTVVASPGGGLNIGGTLYPAVALICGNCGYTRLHNAVILGLFNEGAA